MISYETLFTDWELFLLVFMRIATFISVAPFFNTANTPRRARLVLAFFITVFTYALYPEASYTYTGMIGYTTLVIKEACVGLLLGAMCNMVMQIIHFAGRFIDMDMGLSMASVMDPTNRTQNGIVGTIYFYMVMLILMASGLYQYLIAAIVETFRIIPVGTAVMKISLYHTVIDFMSKYFVIGFRIALPIFTTMLIVNTVLALMSKVAPHMNMFVIGMQLKIVIGLCVLVVTIYMLPAIANYLSQLMKDMIYQICQGLIG